jgi:hypothetical protein
MTDCSRLELLIGKYFIAPHIGAGVVEAALDDAHYLVRYETDAGMPEHLVVAAISDMVGAGADDGPPPWAFFDTIEQRAKFQAWMNQPENPNRPRVVPFKTPP